MQTRTIKILIYGHLVETERFLAALKMKEFKPQIDDNCLTVTIDYINYQIWDMRKYINCKKVSETYTNDVYAAINILEPEYNHRYQFLNDFECSMHVNYEDLTPAEECLREIGQRKFDLNLSLISAVNKKINLIFNSLFDKYSLISIMLPIELVQFIAANLINIEFKNNPRECSFFMDVNLEQIAINKQKKEEDKKNNAPVENKFNWGVARSFFKPSQALPNLPQSNNSPSKNSNF